MELPASSLRTGRFPSDRSDNGAVCARRRRLHRPGSIRTGYCSISRITADRSLSRTARLSTTFTALGSGSSSAFLRNSVAGPMGLISRPAISSRVKRAGSVPKKNHHRLGVRSSPAGWNGSTRIPEIARALGALCGAQSGRLLAPAPCRTAPSGRYAVPSSLGCAEARERRTGPACRSRRELQIAV